MVTNQQMVDAAEHEELKSRVQFLQEVTDEDTRRLQQHKEKVIPHLSALLTNFGFLIMLNRLW